jgi:hypothetical protein
MGGDRRQGFEYAWQTLSQRRVPVSPAATHPTALVRHVGLEIRGTVTRDGEGWVAYLRIEDPPGLSPITTVGRFATVEAAQVATDRVWAAR